MSWRDAEEEAVFGDALQCAGDPFGEIVALRLAMREARGAALDQRLRQIVRREHAALYGELAPHVAPRARGAAVVAKPEWSHGYLVGMRLRSRPAVSLEDAYTCIVRRPFARDLDSLSLEGEGPLPRDLSHPALASLLIGGACVSPEIFPRLASARLPRLEHLALTGWLGGSKVPSLVARMPLLPQLSTLSLRGCGFEDHDLRSFMQRTEAFAHLVELDLGGNSFSARLAREAREVIPSLSMGR